MADSKNLFQNIFDRLFKNEQEEQVHEWLRRIAAGGVEAQNAREALKSLKPDLLLPLLAKIGKDEAGKPVGHAADALYKEVMDAVVKGTFDTSDDLTLGSENLTPKEFLERYGDKAFERRYGVLPKSSGGQSLLAK
jgi:hypothetical protein